MFSENQKISLRQLKYMVFLDMLGVLCVLLPVYLEKETPGSMILSLGGGIALWQLLAGLLAEKLTGESAFAGKKGQSAAAILLLTAAVIYLTAQAAVFLNLCAELAGTYLLPETPLPLLTLLPLAAGILLARGGVEARGRISEVLGPVILALVLIMGAGAAAGGKDWGEASWLRFQDRALPGGYECFVCAGGLFLPLLRGHVKKEEEGMRRKTAGCLRAGSLMAFLLSGAIVLITAVSFGEGGMSRIPFPAVRVMSSVLLPGGFLKRWDVVFLLSLLLSLALALGTALWNLKKTSEAFWRKLPAVGKNAGGSLAFQGLLLFLIYAGASGFLTAEAAMGYYRALNLHLLTPVFLLALFAACWKKKRGKVLGGAAALLLLLGGCTARELEERLFPAAFEIRENEEKVRISFAWYEGNGPEDALTSLEGDSLEDVLGKVEGYGEKYMDYSHVKAIILDEGLLEKKERREELLTWLANDPAFSANLILYPMEESGLTLKKAQERSGGEAGAYLENLYENSEVLGSRGITLGEWLKKVL